MGFADLALSHFGPDGDCVPQVLCEFKDIRSGPDAEIAEFDATITASEEELNTIIYTLYKLTSDEIKMAEAE